MLTLNDCRSELWQWDTGRKLTVDVDCSQVHFSNKVFGRSIDVDVVDGMAIIPDVLLQTDKDLTAWAFVGTPENGYTKISKVFKVNKRNKPSDYVFTPPAQVTLAGLVARLDAIEESQDPDAIKNAVEDYLEQNPVEIPVESVNGKTGAVNLTAEDVGAISKDDLQKATNEALAQAKESGEFDGKDGEPGEKGEQGIQGEKGDTGAQGEPGKDGADGKDGTSATHSWNGTVLTITSASGTSSADLKGEKGERGDSIKGDKGDTGSDGVSISSVKQTTTSSADGGSNVVTVTLSDGTTYTFTVKNGSKGSTGTAGKNGADGKTPVKGVDFWTAADKESIVQDVITALGTPVFGRVDAENNIILTGELVDGTYTIKYEDADGNLTEIGTIEVGGATYTNQIPISIDIDGSVYNGTGYKTATRLNSSGLTADVHNTSASNPVFLTGFIPVKTGDIIRMKNCYADYNGSDTDVSDLNYFGSELGNLRFWTYHDTFECANQILWSELLTSSYVTATADSNGHVTEFTYNGEAPYIRMCLAGDPATAIVTVNEEITD